VIQRNILENPAGTPQYTPYQAEISQGRLEALLNFQTMVIDLTGLEIANASLLDEGTAAAEAMMLMCHRVASRGERPSSSPSAATRRRSDRAHPRAPAGHRAWSSATTGRSIRRRSLSSACSCSTPTPTASIDDYGDFVRRPTRGRGRHDRGRPARADAAAPPGEIRRRRRVGSPALRRAHGLRRPARRLPRHAQGVQAQMPGRIVGVSKDAAGRPALRMALQTREQHIRRDKATSNICTAQVLLAVMAGMYAVYHGPRGCGDRPSASMPSRGSSPGPASAAGSRGAAPVLRHPHGRCRRAGAVHARRRRAASTCAGLDAPFLQHPVFNRYHTEHEMLRYIRRQLEARTSRSATR
jgi:glycine dehydrogenase